MANGSTSIFDIFRDIGVAISSPAGGFLLDQLFFAPEDRRLYEQYQQDVQGDVDYLRRYGEELGLPRRNNLNPSNDPDLAAMLENIQGPTALSGIDDLANQIGGIASEFYGPEAVSSRFSNIFDPIMSDLQGIGGRYGASAAATQRGYSRLADAYSNRAGRARELVSTLGEQERADIDQRFGEFSSAARRGFQQRGFGDSTAANTSILGIERERSSEQRRLTDQLTRAQLGVEETFGGQALAAREAGVLAGQRAGEFGANLGLTTSAAQAGIGTGRFNALDSGTQNLINYLSASGLLGPEYRFKLGDYLLASTPNRVPPQSRGSGVQPNY